MNQDRSSLLHGTYMQRKLLKQTVAPRAAATKLRNLILHPVALQFGLLSDCLGGWLRLGLPTRNHQSLQLGRAVAG